MSTSKKTKPAANPVEEPEVEQDEDLPEDQPEEPASTARKSKVIVKPNEKKKFKGPGVRTTVLLTGYILTDRPIVEDHFLQHGQAPGEGYTSPQWQDWRDCAQDWERWRYRKVGSL
jgi:hypothetical protein